jgi:hypothetical protein
MILSGVNFLKGITILKDYQLPAVIAPTVAVSPSASSVNEGVSITFTVSGSNIPNTTYYWAIQTIPGDFVQQVGSFNVVNNSGSFSVTPIADLTTEGSELFTVTVRTNSTSGTILATSPSVTVNDTSLTPPVYVVTPAAASVNEGSAVTFNVSGSNIANGTYYWTIYTNTTDSYDNPNQAGSLTITNNVGSFTVTPSLDVSTEGPKLFTVALRLPSINPANDIITPSGTIVAISGSVTINDTSTTPAYYGALYWAATGAYLRIGQQPGQPYSLTDFAQVNFTTEFWIKFPTTAPMRLTAVPFAMAETGYWCLVFSTGTPQICRSTTSTFDRGYVSATVNGFTAPYSYGGITINPTAWNHYALVGDGTNIKLYVNGLLLQYVTNGATLASTPSGNPFQIMTTGFYPECYIFDFRHVKNTVYTGDFTPPNRRLSRGGNASIYTSIANVNTTFSTANTVLLLQTYSVSNQYRLYDNSASEPANAKPVYQLTQYDTGDYFGNYVQGTQPDSIDQDVGHPNYSLQYDDHQP